MFLEIIIRKVELSTSHVRSQYSDYDNLFKLCSLYYFILVSFKLVIVIRVLERLVNTRNGKREYHAASNQ